MPRKTTANRSSSSTDQTPAGGTPTAGGTRTDAGARPVTDAGGRPETLDARPATKARKTGAATQVPKGWTRLTRKGRK